MSKETLKRWRMLIPGILLMAWTAPLLLCEFGLSIGLLDPKNILVVVTVVVLGGLYDLFNLRRFAMSKPIDRIHKNIRERLTSPYRNVPGFDGVVALKDADFLRIFYSIVDNDKSLSDQSNDVRLNGLYLSTACDLLVVSAIAFVAYCLVGGYLFWGLGRISQCAVTAAVAAVALWLLSFWFVKRATKEHLKLGDEQLACITQRKELEHSLQEKLLHLVTTHKSESKRAE